MEYFLKAQDKSLQTMENMIDDRHEKLVRNGDEVKEEIQAAFGQYIAWLRERESQLLREVDRAIQSSLWRSQSNLCETFSTLTNFKENVSLLDSEKATKDIKNQIDRLLQEMTSAVQKDMKSSLVVKFNESGSSSLRTAIDSCGEVYTETVEVPTATNVVATSTSKWSNWLQSSNFEQLEEPDMLCDFGFLGSGHKMLRSISPLIKSGLENSGSLDGAFKRPLQESIESRRNSLGCTGISIQKTDIILTETDHFEALMKTPMEQWLKPVLIKHSESPRSARVCPSKNGSCSLNANVEIENLVQLKCVTTIPNELKTWLMQPDVVQLPPVTEICLGNQPCQRFSECTSPAHCIGYFFNLSRRSEDWLAPAKSAPIEPATEHLEITCSRQSTPAASIKSNRSDDFEVLSNSSSNLRDVLKSAISCVSDDLKLWLMSSSEPPADESEWLTIRDDGNEKQKKFHSSNRIEEWLMKC